MLRLSILTLILVLKVNAGLVYSDSYKEVYGDATPTSCQLNKERTLSKIDAIQIHTFCSDNLNFIECKELLFPQESFHEQVESSFVNPNIDCNKNHEEKSEKSVFTNALIGQQSIATVTYAVKDINEALATHEYVRDAYDFKRHTELHIQKVKILSLEIYDSAPERFPNITREQLSMLLDDHDWEKVNPQSRAPDGRPFYKVLHEKGYGKRITDRTLINVLNDQGKEHFFNRAKELGISEKGLKEFIEIEQLGDWIERAKNNVTPEEMGKKVVDATAWPRDRDIGHKAADKMEELRKKVIQSSEYKKLPESQRRNFLKLTLQNAIPDVFSADQYKKDANYIRVLAGDWVTVNVVGEDILEDVQKRYKPLTSGLEYKRLSAAQKSAYVAKTLKEEMAYKVMSKSSTLKSIMARASFAPLLHKAGGGFARAAALLFGKTATRASTLLMALAPTKMGCAYPGGIDYDEDCKEPVPAITPKFLDYLFDTPKNQEHYFSNSHTCQVINKNYQNIKNPFSKVTCHEDKKSSTFYLPKEKERFRLELDKDKNIESIVFDGSTLVGSSIYGNTKSVFFHPDGTINYICFDSNKRISCIKESEKGKYDSSVQRSFSNVNEFVKSMTMPMISSSSCCDDRESNIMDKSHCSNAEYRENWNTVALNHPSILKDKRKKIPFTAPVLEAATADTGINLKPKF